VPHLLKKNRNIYKTADMLHGWQRY